LPRKRDDDAIAAFVDRLAAAPWLSARQREWPLYLFHVTDVRNAASILAGGELLSHEVAVRQNVLLVAASAAEIMDGTAPWVHRQVRLYFRPRTPTFSRNEGLRPPDTRWEGVHCPVPVAMLFDAKHVLGVEGVRWSRQNMAKRDPNPWIRSDAASLEELPFRTIYHDEPIADDEDKKTIVSCRQAEVLVPSPLRIDALRQVVVRSPADHASLRTLLHEHRVTPRRRAELEGLLRIDEGMFIGEWTAVREVARAGEEMIFRFRPPRYGPAVFSARLVWQDSGDKVRLESPAFPLDPIHSWRCRVPAELRGRVLRVSLHLDDALAFTGWFAPEVETLIPSVP